MNTAFICSFVSHSPTKTFTMSFIKYPPSGSQSIVAQFQVETQFCGPPTQFFICCVAYRDTSSFIFRAIRALFRDPLEMRRDPSIGGIWSFKPPKRDFSKHVRIIWASIFIPLGLLAEIFTHPHLPKHSTHLWGREGV